MTCPHYVCSQPWQCTGPRDDGDHNDDDAEDDDGEDEDGADDHAHDDDEEEEEDAALKDVEKGGEEECPSVRTTHAAPDYQEFTALPHILHTACPGPALCSHSATFCIEGRTTLPAPYWPVPPHILPRGTVTGPTLTHILQLQLRAWAWAWLQQHSESAFFLGHPVVQ